MELFYKIRLDPNEFADLLTTLPEHFSIAVYASMDDDCYLIDTCTKAIFDEQGIEYDLEDVCPRHSLSHMRLKFFKKGHHPHPELSEPPATE